MNKFLLREYYALCPDGACNVSILNESEKRMRDDGYTILAGVAQRADAKNHNKRIYPYRTLQREVENYQKSIRENRAYGSLDHDSSETILLERAALLCVRLYWEGKDVIGVFKVLKSTPKGQILEGIIKDGGQVGISSRALGSVTESREGTMVSEDLQILSFDAVSEPSTEGAYLHLQEAKRVDIDENKLYSKQDRIYRALNDILFERYSK